MPASMATSVAHSLMCQICWSAGTQYAGSGFSACRIQSSASAMAALAVGLLDVDRGRDKDPAGGPGGEIPIGHA